MADAVNLTPAQVLELDRLRAEAADAWVTYERAAARAIRRLGEVLEAAGVPEVERTRTRGWRMVVEGEAVKLLPADGDGDGEAE